MTGRPTGRPAGRPFTVAVCRAGPCHGGDTDTGLLDRLRATIRRSPHGILISTGCLLRHPRCRLTAAHDSGCYLVVQRCDTGRRPYGAAIALGPVLDSADVEAVATWLATDTLDPTLLTPRLRAGTRAA